MAIRRCFILPKIVVIGEQFMLQLNPQITNTKGSLVGCLTRYHCSSTYLCDVQAFLRSVEEKGVNKFNYLDQSGVDSGRFEVLNNRCC